MIYSLACPKSSLLLNWCPFTVSECFMFSIGLKSGELASQFIFWDPQKPECYRHSVVFMCCIWGRVILHKYDDSPKVIFYFFFTKVQNASLGGLYKHLQSLWYTQKNFPLTNYDTSNNISSNEENSSSSSSLLVSLVLMIISFTL